MFSAVGSLAIMLAGLVEGVVEDVEAPGARTWENPLGSRPRPRGGGTWGRYPRVPVTAHVAGGAEVGRRLADDHRDERRLAGAVAPDQADLLAGADDERGVPHRARSPISMVSEEPTIMSVTRWPGRGRHDAAPARHARSQSLPQRPAGPGPVVSGRWRTARALRRPGGHRHRGRLGHRQRAGRRPGRPGGDGGRWPTSTSRRGRGRTSRGGRATGPEAAAVGRHRRRARSSALVEPRWPTHGRLDLPVQQRRHRRRRAGGEAGARPTWARVDRRRPQQRHLRGGRRLPDDGARQAVGPHREHGVAGRAGPRPRSSPPTPPPSTPWSGSAPACGWRRPPTGCGSTRCAPARSRRRCSRPAPRCARPRTRVNARKLLTNSLGAPYPARGHGRRHPGRGGREPGPHRGPARPPARPGRSTGPSPRPC